MIFMPAVFVSDNEILSPLYHSQKWAKMTHTVFFCVAHLVPFKYDQYILLYLHNIKYQFLLAGKSTQHHFR